MTTPDLPDWHGEFAERDWPLVACAAALTATTGLLHLLALAPLGGAWPLATAPLHALGLACLAAGWRRR